MFDKNSAFLEIMKICNKIFRMSFQCKIKDGEIIIPSNRKHKDHFFLLFAIPGIITIAMASIAGDQKCLIIINEIKEILSSETDFSIIYERLLGLFSSELIPRFDDNIERLSFGMKLDDLKELIDGPIPDGISDELFEFMRTNIVSDELKTWVKTDLVSYTIIGKILQFESNYDFGGYDALVDSEEEMSRNFPPGIVALLILLNYKNSSFYESSNSHSFQPANWSLIFAFGNYYILTSMIYGNIVSDRECVALTKLEMAFMELIYDVKIGQFNHYNVFSMLTESCAKGMVADLIKSKDMYRHQRTITTTVPKVFLHEYSHKNKILYVLSQTINIKNELKANDDELIGVAVNTTILPGIDFKLILIVTINDKYKPAYEYLEGTYLLVKNQTATAEDNLSVMANQLYQIVKRCSAYAISILASWQELIDRPGDKIGSDIDSFNKMILSFITEHYEERDELFRLTSLSRLIGRIDTEIFNKNVDKTRKVFKEAKKHTLPLDLRKKLLEADKELMALMKDVTSLKNCDLGVADSVLKCFKENRDSYKYLSLLDYKDIKKIIHATEDNSYRYNRWRILPKIYTKLTGQTIGKSTLTKMLGLETGDQHYLKWTSGEKVNLV